VSCGLPRETSVGETDTGDYHESVALGRFSAVKSPFFHAGGG
jgi:hypothetical protein